MEFLKELFAAGALTWEQFSAAVTQAKLDVVNAAGGAYVPKEKAEAIKAERDGLKTQLADAGKQIEQFKGMDVEGIQKAADEW